MSNREHAFRAARMRQPIAELKRKADKARRRQSIWTVEELDWAKARGAELHEALKDLWQ